MYRFQTLAMVFAGFGRPTAFCAFVGCTGFTELLVKTRSSPCVSSSCRRKNFSTNYATGNYIHVKSFLVPCPLQHVWSVNFSRDIGMLIRLLVAIAMRRISHNLLPSLHDCRNTLLSITIIVTVNSLLRLRMTTETSNTMSANTYVCPAMSYNIFITLFTTLRSGLHTTDSFRLYLVVLS